MLVATTLYAVSKAVCRRAILLMGDVQSTEREDANQSSSLLPRHLQLDHLMDGKEQDQCIEEDVDQSIREPKGFATKAMARGMLFQDTFIPKRRYWCALKNCHQDKGNAGCGGNAN